MNYLLTAHPDATWDEVASQPFTGWYWCDPDGAHVETTPPEHLPAATHLWAWGDGTWGRWRIDPLGRLTGAPSITGATLTRDGSVGDTAAVVEVLETETWSARDPVNLRGELRGRSVTVLQVSEPVQLTFFEVRLP